MKFFFTFFDLLTFRENSECYTSCSGGWRGSGAARGDRAESEGRDADGKEGGARVCAGFIP